MYINEPYCVDIDECNNRGVCPRKSSCQNTAGSYICRCYPGFGGDICEDIDECNQTSTCDTNASCLNTEGSYVCSCNLGYRGNGITCKLGQCDDLRCPPDQKCISKTTTECQCNEGFSMNTEMDFCEDIDECLLDHGCDQNSTCVNSKGSFSCECNLGYIGDGTTCVEGICSDEACPTNAECVMPSKPDCRCKNGFELKLWESNQTGTCVDTDECSSLEEICPENTVCRNFPGGYECNCKDGYFGDGQTCFRGYCSVSNCPPSDNKQCVSLRSNLCKCTEGYNFNNSSVCVDVDECQNEPCDKNANCTNNLGSFSCSCRTGYLGDGISCKERKTVLVLSSYENNRKPLLIDAKGRRDRNLVVSFGEQTEVYKSCSVTYRNRFYVFGGERHERQISEVTLCGLKRIGSLEFDHKWGACSNTDNRKIYLCFGLSDTKQCRSAADPLGKFTEIASSAYRHYGARTAASSSKFDVINGFCIISAELLAVGSFIPSHAKTEMYLSEVSYWKEFADYPFD